VYWWRYEGDVRCIGGYMRDIRGPLLGYEGVAGYISGHTKKLHTRYISVMLGGKYMVYWWGYE